MEFNFVAGKAVLKEGKKIIAKVFDRNVFFKGTRYENTFKQFPYSVEMMGGIFECTCLEDATRIYLKYKP